MGRQLYQSQVPWRVDSLRVNAVVAYRAKSLQLLYETCRKDNTWTSFYSSSSNITVCFPRDLDPEVDGITFSQRLPRRTTAGGHQSASLWIDASHINISNLHFDHTVFASINLWDSSHIRISDNRFTNSDVAVNGYPSVGTPYFIDIVRNLSEYAPLHEWNESWLTWHQLYGYSNSSLTWLAGSSLNILNNLVCQGGDGIKLLSKGPYNNLVSRNILSMLVDDAIELDSSSHNISVSENLVASFLAAISITPIDNSSVFLRGNIFIGSAADQMNVLLKALSISTANIYLSKNFFLGRQLFWLHQDSPINIAASDNLFIIDMDDSVNTSFLPELKRNNDLRSLFDSNHHFDMISRSSRNDVTLLLDFNERLHSIGPDWLNHDEPSLSYCLESFKN